MADRRTTKRIHIRFQDEPDRKDIVTTQQLPTSCSMAGIPKGATVQARPAMMEAPTTLTAFSKLPFDVRVMIWKLAMPDPRYIEVSSTPTVNGYHFKSLSKKDQSNHLIWDVGLHLRKSPPALLFVCKESRDEFTRQYYPIENSRGHTTWVDFKRDFFCFRVTSMAGKIMWWQEILDEANILDKIEHISLDHWFLGDASRGYPTAFDFEDLIEFSALRTLRLHVGEDAMAYVSPTGRKLVKRGTGGKDKKRKMYDWGTAMKGLSDMIRKYEDDYPEWAKFKLEYQLSDEAWN